MTNIILLKFVRFQMIFVFLPHYELIKFILHRRMQVHVQVA